MEEDDWSKKSGIDESIVWEMIKTNLSEVKPWIEKAIQEIGDIT